MADGVFDIAIIGGGIVGCAVLRELTERGYFCVLLEKEADLASGATGGNSAHLSHNPSPYETKGASPNEHECIMTSAPLWEDVMTQYALPNRLSEAIMIARNSDELEKIKGYVRTAQQNGVSDVKLLTGFEVLAMEPNINASKLKGGMLVPAESMVDSNLVAVTLAHSALRQGAKIQYKSEVTEARQTGDGIWEMKTPGGNVRASHVINAAGLYGDHVERLAGNTPRFTIKPRKGQFAVFDKSAGSLLKHMILPVPSETTKGVIIFTSVYGNLVVGPTAEEIYDRSNPTVNQQTIDKLVHYAQQVVPALKGAGPKEAGPKEAGYEVIGSYAGIRPATAESKDYYIYATPHKKWITVAGIRSTGQTACLGIAKKVADLVTSDLDAKPSRSPPRSRSSAVAWVTDKPSYVLDGVEYAVRHPLMKYGLSKPKAKL